MTSQVGRDSHRHELPAAASEFACRSHLPITVGEVDWPVKEGFVAGNGDLCQLTPKAEKVLSDRGAGLNEA